MQKAKSLSLSEKDQNKIIKIIHSKVTPLKFKYKIFQQDLRHQLNLSLSKQKIRHGESLDEKQLQNKRISISTFIQKNCEKQHRKSTKGRQFRSSVLNTQTILKQQKFILSLINQTEKQNLNQECKQSIFQKHKSLIQLQDSQSLLTPATHEKSSNLMGQLFMLQKRKMLKSLKLQIQERKTKVLEDIKNYQKRKIENQTLHKKGNPQASEYFKQKTLTKLRQSEDTDISHQQGLALRRQKNQRNSLIVQHCGLNQGDIQELEQLEEIKKQKKQASMLKEYIKFFKDDDEENKRLKYAQYLKMRNEKTCKFINYQSFLDDDKKGSFRSNSGSEAIIQERNFRNSQSINIKNEFKLKKSTMREKSFFKFSQDRQSQTFDQNSNQMIDPSLINAKMRIRSNHKKIVNLGKMQKISALTTNGKYQIKDVK